MSNFITTAFLNLRSLPVVAPGNVLGIIPPDAIVEKLADSDTPGWIKIKALLSKIWVEGFSSQKFLQPTEEPLPVIPAALNIPKVHYPAGARKVIRDATGLWVYPLNETGMPQVTLNTLPDIPSRVAAIHALVTWLNVEASKRYAPNPPATYCNIYAYDVAFGLGAYLPRVWWTAEAIGSILAGQTLTPRYDDNVTEYTANRICNWFDQYGASFGWTRFFDMDLLQKEVNDGKLGIIVGQRIKMNTPGHIVAVVPENDQQSAKRSNGLVTSPLQSQAGAKNKKYFSGYNWWEDTTRFKKFSFWVWDKPAP